jgi:hypothetical protein
MSLSTLMRWALIAVCLLQNASVFSFNIMDYSHYLDYLPLRQEGIAWFEDFRTAPVKLTLMV